MAGKTKPKKFRGEWIAVPVRDSQRARVYKAEREAFGEDYGGLIDKGSFKSAVRFVRKVEATKTWAKLLGYSNLTPVYPGLEVKDGRGTRIARGGRYTLNLPTWARSKLVILHEMAHAATPGMQHNWPFCDVYLALVGMFMGDAARKRLQECFKKHKVRFRKPRQLSPEHLAKLRAQGQKLAAMQRAKREQNP